MDLPEAEEGYMFMYVLLDPISCKIRYVGKCVNPKRRYYSHVSSSKLANQKFHNAVWIKSLLSSNLKPIMRIIEKLPNNLLLWEIRENFWINFYKTLGFDLTNTRTGGGSATTYGRLGKRNSEEHKKKCSVARKGKYVYHPPRPEETKEKLRKIALERHRKQVKKTI